jgi:hypothetical protein
MQLPRLFFAAAVVGFTAVPAFPQFHVSGNCDRKNVADPSRPLEVDLMGGRFQPVTGAPFSARESSLAAA